MKKNLCFSKKKFSLLCAFFVIFFIRFNVFAEQYYWEDSIRLADIDSRFPSVVSNNNESYIFWEEIDSKEEKIYLTACYQNEKNEWVQNRRFAGPFIYSGNAPEIYSVAISKNGVIAVVVIDISEQDSFSIYCSNDNAKSFSNVKISSNSTLFAPRIYSTSNGGFLIFASTSKGSYFSNVIDADDFYNFSDLQFNLNYAISSDGISWSAFKEFSPSSKLKNAFVPYFCESNNQAVVVFQAQHTQGAVTTYQLYATFSNSELNSWSDPILLTNENTVSSLEKYYEFQNQRPFVYNFNGKFFVAWERRFRYSENDNIWTGEFNSSGMIKGETENIASSGNSKRGVLFSEKNSSGKDILSVVWFDSRSGNEAIYMAQKNGALWEETKLSSGKGSFVFPHPILISQKNESSNTAKLGFVWQVNLGTTSKTPQINLLSPDISVASPHIATSSVKQNSRSKTNRIRFNISLPRDSSEIAGYVYSWSQDENENPVQDENNLLLPREKSVFVNATEEGKWYFKAIAYDYAGNWSKPAVFSYNYDTTPPGKVVFSDLPIDKGGFVAENSFVISWNPNEIDEDVKGYTYSIRKIGDIEKKYNSSSRHKTIASEEDQIEYAENLLKKYSYQIEKNTRLPEKIMSIQPQTSFSNLLNGVYVFTVSAIDEVGFIGESVHIPIIINKYEPKTTISSIKTTQNRYGQSFMTISGNDFLYDGRITKIIIDKDAKAPYDEEISSEFKILNNNYISNIPVSQELDDGSYFVGIVHSDRGLFFTKRAVLHLENLGTIKIDNPYEYVPLYNFVQNDYKFSIDMTTLIFVLALIVSFLVAIYFGIAIIGNINEKILIHNLIYSEKRGGIMTASKNSSSNKHGSLLYEIIGFTFALIMFIVLGIAIPLYRYNKINTERTLCTALQEKVNMLLTSLSSGAKSYMPSENILELSMLPDQMSSLQEAELATISGFASSENTSDNSILHVWATNDKNILEKIDTKELILGKSVITYEISQKIAENCKKLNESVSNVVSKKAHELAKLNEQGVVLSLKNDPNSLSRLEEITLNAQKLTLEINSTLDDFALDNTGSVPAFNLERLNRNQTSYLFYRPILFRMAGSNDFVRGIVFIRVSTESLIYEVDVALKRILIIVSCIAAFVLLLGAIGAVVIGRHIAKPIRILEKFVQKIANEKHKENLAGEKKNIEVSRNDEIGRLGEAMNRLKEELAAAAIEEKLTNDGKAVQKAFLPLDKAEGGVGQKTTASYSDDKIMAFGYYEGASAVSGDYFDYKKLDERYYVFIKSDASGHGTPAGLIMTVVATLFNKFFENWEKTIKSIDITKLVYQINDFLESLGLKGKFATIIIVLYDSKNGMMYMCNAGDNIVHIYDNISKKMMAHILKETPAAGPFPGFLVDMKGGFVLENGVLNENDILFLYTDGIEESTRLVRDSNYQIVQEEKNGKFEDKKELLEADRVQKIIESVIARTKYVLKKEQNPDETEELIFDFSTCDGTYEDAIIGLVSVEKVFRFYKPDTVTSADQVHVDKKIDAFLKKHFNLYEKYCHIDESVSEEDTENEYVIYNYIMEDDQADDLTMLAIQRKQ